MMIQSLKNMMKQTEIKKETQYLLKMEQLNLKTIFWDLF